MNIFNIFFFLLFTRCLNNARNQDFAYVGWHCSPILMRLLQQGSNDPEKFVTKKAIIAMAMLTEQGLLHKTTLYQLLLETDIFLLQHMLQ